jgi:GNAT superfamily N-acetyltransferase
MLAGKPDCHGGRGENVTIRSMTAQDGQLYREFIANVSAEDLRLRFFATGPELISDEAKRLSHLDPRRSAAFIAVDIDSGSIFGLARLEDDLDESSSQFAILVRTAVKGHGVGWQLMQQLISYANIKGLRRLYGDVLAHNRTMLQMCGELGFRFQEAQTGVRRVVLDLQACKKGLGLKKRQPESKQTTPLVI